MEEMERESSRKRKVSSSNKDPSKGLVVVTRGRKGHGHGKGQHGGGGGGGVELTPEVTIQKILIHSGDSSSPRLLKYLNHAKKTFSSTNLKLWMDLRRKGALVKIEGIIREGVGGGGGQEEDKVKGEVFSVCLSLLGNAYSLDYSARKEVSSNGFIQVLHQLLKDKQEELITYEMAEQQDRESVRLGSMGASTSSFASASSVPTKEKPKLPLSPRECETKTKVVKCIANLAHDSVCREGILKSGIGISILKLLSSFNLYFVEEKEDTATENVDTAAGGNGNKEKESELELLTDCTRTFVRAMRILSSEAGNEEAKSHLIRFRAVFVLGGVLKWGKNEDLKLDVVRSLANLTDKVRLLPNDQVEELISDDSKNELLKNLVILFGGCDKDSKLFSPLIRCLKNLGSNTCIAEYMVRIQVYKVALLKLFEASDKSVGEICRLLLTLTKNSAVNQCILFNCKELWTTFNILRRDTLQEHHRWIFYIYENAYEGTLQALVRHGLIELIQEHFKKELEDFDYDMLTNKIFSLEENTCPAHNERCQFIPVYRCDSPSYQQVQEETKILLKNRGDVGADSGCSSGMDSSSSPSNSPARSWASDDSSSDASFPFRSCSPLCISSSDDEACYSPTYSSNLSLSPVYSEDGEGSPPEGISSPELRYQHRTNHGGEDVEPMEIDTNLDLDPSKKSENLRNKSKKIVTMLNILHKTSFISPIPNAIVHVVPVLLSFIIRGIVSLTPQKQKYRNNSKDSEMAGLGRRSYNLAYKILIQIYHNIHFFPQLVKNGTVIILARLLPWDDAIKAIGSSETMNELFDHLRGKSNESEGWREGHLRRTLLVSKDPDEVCKAVLAIPLLYQNNEQVLRSFENKGNSWTRLFDMLTMTDEITPAVFQDCILSVSALCKCIGMTYDPTDVANRPQLLQNEERFNFPEILQFVDNEDPLKDSSVLPDGKVIISLDDGDIIVSKSVLTESSPVFSAMLDGSFKESVSQQVKIPDATKQSFSALVEQMYLLDLMNSTNNGENNVTNRSYNDLEFSSLLDLITLSDRFLLESIYERALNTLSSKYICPYSAPEIYLESVKLSTLAKSQSHLARGWDMDLTFVVLKYLLVGDLGGFSKCSAFRKIFDMIPTSTVVGDIRALVEFYSTRPKGSR